MISVSRYLKIFCFCALFLDFPLPAQAEVEDGAHVDPAIVESLMFWVEKELGVKVPVPPQVIASRKSFDKIIGRMEARYAGRPQSIYVPGKVYMDSSRWDPEDYVQISLLVHELVHHAQMFMPGRAWACQREKEILAYNLQNKWLEQNGHYPFANDAWIKRVSSCPEKR